MVRLDKYLCDCGVGSRSQVKQILKAGRVAVDGVVTADGSIKLDPKNQTVTLDGQALIQTGTVVLMLNKPAGYITATEDPRQETVMALLPQEYRHLELKPVGRLDKDTEGLLLFTNDGDLLHRLISPKKQIWKVYYARHAGMARVCSLLTGLFACRQSWSPWQRGRAWSGFARGNTIRCGVCWHPEICM